MENKKNNLTPESSFVSKALGMEVHVVQDNNNPDIINIKISKDDIKGLVHANFPDKEIRDLIDFDSAFWEAFDRINWYRVSIECSINIMEYVIKNIGFLKKEEFMP